MNFDELSKLAKKAKVSPIPDWFSAEGKALRKFAILVAEDEREECAKLADHTFYRNLGSQPHLQGVRTNYADTIRARGKK